jgi:hypothetical protein
LLLDLQVIPADYDAAHPLAADPEQFFNNLMEISIWVTRNAVFPSDTELFVMPLCGWQISIANCIAQTLYQAANLRSAAALGGHWSLLHSAGLIALCLNLSISDMG